MTDLSSGAQKYQTMHESNWTEFDEKRLFIDPRPISQINQITDLRATGSAWNPPLGNMYPVATSTLQQTK